MCGIAGIVAARDGAVDEARLVRMRDSMAHRGPDGAGVWVDPARRVGLAHRRLAIVDLTPTGAQPMASEDGRARIVYNGEVYNHVDLRRELEGLGHRFVGRSDTEVLLRGWLAWGEALLDRLVGMFAFAVWDADRGELFAARDRIGVKPFYFTEAGGAFLFASEIKGLLADDAVPRAMDRLAAWHYLTFIVPPAPLTMFRGVYKLPAGHALSVRPGQPPRIRRWWDPVDAPPADLDPAVYQSDDAAAVELLRRLDRSIERRMMSDVPFGVFLSGGVDSSTNVALMARHMDRPVETFSVSFRDQPGHDESAFARLVAGRFATRHHEVVIDESDMLDYLPDLVWNQDEPIADWVCVPLHFVAELARDSGVIVVQLGEGSDELLCGYDHFRDVLKSARHYGPIARLPRALRGVPAAIAGILGRFDEGWARRAAMAARVASGKEIFLGAAIGWDDAEKEAAWRGALPTGDDYPDFVPRGLAGRDADGVVKALLEPFRRENPHADFYQQMLYLELRARLPELLLMRVDKILMASSVEGRDPFLDHELVAFCMDLPQRMRVRDGVGKWLLKKAVRGLIPDEVIDRPKMGFGAPVAEWLRGDFGGWARGRLAAAGSDLFRQDAVASLFEEHASGRVNRALHIWTLLNLALWHDHWIAGRPQPSPAVVR